VLFWKGEEDVKKKKKKGGIRSWFFETDEGEKVSAGDKSEKAPVDLLSELDSMTFDFEDGEQPEDTTEVPSTRDTAEVPLTSEVPASSLQPSAPLQPSVSGLQEFEAGQPLDFDVIFDEYGIESLQTEIENIARTLAHLPKTDSLDRKRGTLEAVITGLGIDAARIIEDGRVKIGALRQYIQKSQQERDDLIRYNTDKIQILDEETAAKVAELETQMQQLRDEQTTRTEELQAETEKGKNMHEEVEQQCNAKTKEFEEVLQVLGSGATGPSTETQQNNVKGGDLS